MCVEWSAVQYVLQCVAVSVAVSVAVCVAVCVEVCEPSCMTRSCVTCLCVTCVTCLTVCVCGCVLNLSSTAVGKPLCYTSFIFQQNPKTVCTGNAMLAVL